MSNLTTSKGAYPMSHNLAFEKGKIWVDFPFQTPTSITWKVLSVHTIEERLAILREYLTHDKMDNDDREYVKDILARIETMMRDETMTLIAT